MKVSPWARRQARRAAVQALYQWQMTAAPVADIVQHFTLDGSLKKADREFFIELLRGTVMLVSNTAAPVVEDKAPVEEAEDAVAEADGDKAPTTEGAKEAESESEPEPTPVVHNNADVPFAAYLDRKPSELDKVELAILRLGSYELAERIDVPYKVVIDEYVELSKTFGAEESHKYVNAVLDKVAGAVRTLETQARS